jgi:hypothetical protein
MAMAPTINVDVNGSATVVDASVGSAVVAAAERRIAPAMP